MNIESEKLQVVFEKIVKIHSGQFRKANVVQLPYAFHPMQVMLLLYDIGLSEAEYLYILFACLGHDVLEDTDFTVEALTELIGERAVSIVKELTFISDKKGKEYQEEKKRHLYEFKSKSIEALVIKVADRICNVLDFMKTDKEYAKIYCGKAIGLWEAFESRLNEVGEFFGQDFAKALNTKVVFVRTLN
jgi:(p)ppGpp synthase/HD superfamily hydrolase